MTRYSCKNSEKTENKTDSEETGGTRQSRDKDVYNSEGQGSRLRELRNETFLFCQCRLCFVVVF